MRALKFVPVLVLSVLLAGPTAAMPVVRVSDIIGNPMRYQDVRVKLSGLVTKVEPDPLTPNRVIYTLQDSSDQVIRVKSLVPPELDSHIYVVGAVAQDDRASKPYIVEIKHMTAGLPLPLLIGAGCALALVALILTYFILVPRPTRKKPRAMVEDEPELERRPVITQVFHDDPVAILVAMAGPYKGEIFKVFRGANTIGRDDNQTVQLPDDLTISRRHARIEANNGSLTIVNESSTNPTKVAGQEIDERELSDGDVIQIGSTRLRVTVVSD